MAKKDEHVIRVRVGFGGGISDVIRASRFTSDSIGQLVLYSPTTGEVNAIFAPGCWVSAIGMEDVVNGDEKED